MTVRVIHASLQEMRTVAIRATVLLVACVLVAGCGNAKRSGSASSAASSDGTFQTAIPTGFKNTNSSKGVYNTLYTAASPRKGIAVTVLRAPFRGSSLDQWARAGVAGMQRTSHAIHDFSKLTPTTVAGAPARGVSYLEDLPSGAMVHGLEYVLHDRTVYAINATGPANDWKDVRAALAAVTANWHWTGN